MSSFPLTFIFSKMVETTNQYIFISHPQPYDDPSHFLFGFFVDPIHRFNFHPAIL